MTSDTGWPIDVIAIPRVVLRLRAGIIGFETEADMSHGAPLIAPASAIQALKAEPDRLLALRVRDQGMEPMLFEDDWIVINTGDTALRSGDVYAINWNGEACIQQLVKRAGQWYLSYANPRFHPINVRSGQINVVGRVVYQEARALGGRLSP